MISPHAQNSLLGGTMHVYCLYTADPTCGNLFVMASPHSIAVVRHTDTDIYVFGETWLNYHVELEQSRI